MTMDKAFLAAYSLRLIAACHRRGAHAMGGMSAFIPVKGDEQANRGGDGQGAATTSSARSGNGHDGTWVAHPALVPVAMQAFEAMEGPTSLPRCRSMYPAARRCWSSTTGPRTEAGARENIRVGVQYLAAWLGGRGAVPLYNLMEDAATAEISRAQLWQWLHFGAELDDACPERSRGGRTFDRDLFDQLFDEEIGRLQDVENIERSSRAVPRDDRQRRLRGVPDPARLRTAGLRRSPIRD
jgi:malate synthase